MTVNRAAFILISVATLLLIPLIAMQFSSEVNWGLMDFAIAGFLLVVTGFSAEFALRRINSFDYRIVVILVILIIFLLIWAELAVGIFGSPFAGS